MSKVHLSSALGTTSDIGSAGPSAARVTTVSLYPVLFLTPAAESLEAKPARYVINPDIVEGRVPLLAAKQNVKKESA
jgi:hypothetical protein